MSYKEIIDNVSNIEDLDNTTILKVLEKFSKTIKDFAIEQSGLNNLVNVEFIPSDNNTTYTGNSVDYLGTLKLTLSDNIIVNKPCNIKFNIKGSNTIVVDVDEFSNSLELHLDNSVVTTLDFAESERQKSQTDGAIVHEKENPYPLLEYHELLLSANQTVNYESSTDLSFDTVPTNSTYISVNSDKNIFTILKPCKIKITGNIIFNQATNTNVDLHIMKNTTESVNCFTLKFDANKGMMFNISPKIIDMSTNDRFSLRLISGGSGATASMKYFYTRVLVEVFKQ